MSSSGRQLLVAVVKGHRRLELVMEGFLELELPGATVLDAKGMGQIVSTELPIFSGFRSLFPGGGEESYLILSVLTADQVDEAIGLLRDVSRSRNSSASKTASTSLAHRVEREFEGNGADDLIERDDRHDRGGQGSPPFREAAHDDTGQTQADPGLGDEAQSAHPPEAEWITSQGATQIRSHPNQQESDRHHQNGDEPSFVQRTDVQGRTG